MRLPTYAFDHIQYWANIADFVGDPTSLGQAATGHPLLGAMVSIPESGGAVLTGRLSLRTHPWLADYRVDGVSLFPTTGLIELAIRADVQDLLMGAPTEIEPRRLRELHIDLGVPDTP